MNYLAHLFLAEDSPDSKLGNLLGDFVKGSIDDYRSIYNQEIIKGIKTHQQVDIFTDHHPVFIRSKRRISSNYNHFAGVIIDVCYDHFLANHWGEFSKENLEDFAANFYTVLEEKQAILPQKLKYLIPVIVKENWLCSYKNIEGIGRTFIRLSYRCKHKNNLDSAHYELLKNYRELEGDFLDFFPELIEGVMEVRQKLS